jgi:ElaB/YqjD/DUF883 family membrane-anchored ribosome-binding protein
MNRKTHQGKTVAEEATVQESAKRVAGAVEEEGKRVAHSAADSFKQGRARALECEQRLENIVRERPLMSVLVACGIGILIGAARKRL